MTKFKDLTENDLEALFNDLNPEPTIVFSNEGKETNLPSKYNEATGTQKQLEALRGNYEKALNQGKTR